MSGDLYKEGLTRANSLMEDLYGVLLCQGQLKTPRQRENGKGENIIITLWRYYGFLYVILHFRIQQGKESNGDFAGLVIWETHQGSILQGSNGTY